MRLDGKDLGPGPNQQDFLVANVTRELPIDKIGERHALGEIGAARWRLFLRHVWSSAIAAHKRQREHSSPVPGGNRAGFPGARGDKYCEAPVGRRSPRPMPIV
jgi:hypothetical protein